MSVLIQPSSGPNLCFFFDLLFNEIFGLNIFLIHYISFIYSAKFGVTLSLFRNLLIMLQSILKTTEFIRMDDGLGDLEPLVLNSRQVLLTIRLFTACWCLV